MYDIQAPENISTDTEPLAIVKHNRNLNKSLIIVSNVLYISYPTISEL